MFSRKADKVQEKASELSSTLAAVKEAFARVQGLQGIPSESHSLFTETIEDLDRLCKEMNDFCANADGMGRFAARKRARALLDSADFKSVAGSFALGTAGLLCAVYPSH